MGLKIKESILKVRQMLCLEAAVRYGSISRAAEKNNMKQSNLSVQIKLLEEELGETLISRVHNGIKLTEAGEEIYSLACNMENIINNAKTINIKAFRVAGAIRLWTSDGLGTGYISECFPEFYASYPKVNIEIVCSLEMPKPDQFDMAIIYDEPTDSSLKVIDKYDLKFGVFASKEYLAKFGYPKDLKDIQENHRICTRSNYASVWAKWENVVSHSQKVAASTNSSAMLLQLIKDGIGIGVLPIGTAVKEPDLIYLNKIKLNLHHKFWIVVRKELQDIDKIKALVKFIQGASCRL